MGRAFSGLRAGRAPPPGGRPGPLVRFHGLPDARRHPECEAGYAALLGRFNAVPAALVSPGRPVVLLTTRHPASAEPGRPDSGVPGFDTPAAPWRTVARHAADDTFTGPTFRARLADWVSPVPTGCRRGRPVLTAGPDPVIVFP